jgi:hypothetical protein
MMTPETDATTSVRKAEMSFMLGVNWDMQGLYTVSGANRIPKEGQIPDAGHLEFNSA